MNQQQVQTTGTKKTNVLLIVIILIVVLAIIGGAAYYFLNYRRSGVIKTEDGKLVSYKKNGEQVTLQDESGSMTIGEGTKLPANFPKDIPIYPGINLTSTVVQESGESGYTGTSKDNTEKVMTWFKSEVVKKGWKIDLESKGHITISNGEYAGAAAASEGEDGKTEVSFSKMKKNKHSD